MASSHDSAPRQALGVSIEDVPELDTASGLTITAAPSTSTVATQHTLDLPDLRIMMEDVEALDTVRVLGGEYYKMLLRKLKQNAEDFENHDYLIWAREQLELEQSQPPPEPEKPRKVKEAVPENWDDEEEEEEQAEEEKKKQEVTEPSSGLVPTTQPSQAITAWRSHTALRDIGFSKYQRTTILKTLSREAAARTAGTTPPPPKSPPTANFGLLHHLQRYQAALETAISNDWAHYQRQEDFLAEYLATGDDPLTGAMAPSAWAIFNQLPTHYKDDIVHFSADEPDAIRAFLQARADERYDMRHGLHPECDPAMVRIVKAQRAGVRRGQWKKEARMHEDWPEERFAWLRQVKRAKSSSGNAGAKPRWKAPEDRRAAASARKGEFETWIAASRTVLASKETMVEFPLPPVGSCRVCEEEVAERGALRICRHTLQSWYGIPSGGVRDDSYEMLLWAERKRCHPDRFHKCPDEVREGVVRMAAEYFKLLGALLGI